MEESGKKLPLTSYPCQWKAPRKRKQSNLMPCLKNVYGRATSGKKRQRLEDFDPWPLKHRGNADTQYTTY